MARRYVGLDVSLKQTSIAYLHIMTRELQNLAVEVVDLPLDGFHVFPSRD
jgi:hypothetical protein